MRRKPVILMVEEDAHLAEIYARHFALHKCQSKAVRSFSEADKKIKKALPDLLLVDIALEEQNGLKWIKALRAEETTKAVPVVVLTGMGDRASIQEALRLGADKYFLKSQITPRDLALQLDSLLNPKK